MSVRRTRHEYRDSVRRGPLQVPQGAAERIVQLSKSCSHIRRLGVRIKLADDSQGADFLAYHINGTMNARDDSASSGAAVF